MINVKLAPEHYKNSNTIVLDGEPERENNSAPGSSLLA
jgi:hypothetical protein